MFFNWFYIFIYFYCIYATYMYVYWPLLCVYSFLEFFMFMQKNFMKITRSRRPLEIRYKLET